MAGKVYLIGAGPGAPDLITARGAEILKRADVVFYDALVHPDTVALAVNAKKIAVGKRCKGISTQQRFINRALAEAGLKYRTVVRLKGGDPMLFGRSQEEIEALKRAGVAYEVVPGVTAALAAGAELGVSLTRRGLARSVAFVTSRSAHGEQSDQWAEVVKAADTSVIYMGVGQAQEVAGKLLAKGLAPTTPVVIVESASLPQLRCTRFSLDELSRAAELAVTGPAIIMLGEVFRAASTEELERSAGEIVAYGNSRRR